MSARWCVKLLLLVTLLPLALRAASMLLAGHAAVPASSSSHRHSPITSRATGGDAPATAGRAGVVSAAGSANGRAIRRTRHRRRAEGALDGARRLRQADVDGRFEDDKRLAPTGSNPLHNLR